MQLNNGGCYDSILSLSIIRFDANYQNLLVGSTYCINWMKQCKSWYIQGWANGLSNLLLYLAHRRARATYFVCKFDLIKIGHDVSLCLNGSKMTHVEWLFCVQMNSEGASMVADAHSDKKNPNIVILLFLSLWWFKCGTWWLEKNPRVYENWGVQWMGDTQSWCDMTSGERIMIFVSKGRYVGIQAGLHSNTKYKWHKNIYKLIFNRTIFKHNVNKSDMEYHEMIITVGYGHI